MDANDSEHVREGFEILVLITILKGEVFGHLKGFRVSVATFGASAPNVNAHIIYYYKKSI